MCRGLNTSSDTLKQPESPETSHGDIIRIISYKKQELIIQISAKLRRQHTFNLIFTFIITVFSMFKSLSLSLSLAFPLTHPCLLEHPHLQADPQDLRAKSHGPNLVHHVGRGSHTSMGYN